MKIIKLTVLVCILILSNIFILQKANLSKEYIVFQMKIEAENTDEIQVFFQQNGVWLEESSQRFSYIKPNQKQTIRVLLPYGIEQFRFNFGKKLQKITMFESSIGFYGKKWNLWNDDEVQMIEKNLLSIEHDGKYYVKLEGEGSYLVFGFHNNFYQNCNNHYRVTNMFLKLSICFFVSLILIVIFLRSKSVVLLMTELNNNRILIWNLAKNDFKTKYAGSYLGIVWAFVNPVITILIYWFVFSYGLKAGSPIEGVPFILWFMCGLIPWFLFQDALLNATNCLVEYSYLVKKVVFKISVLPIIKILSAIFIHFVFIVFLLVVAMIYGITPNMMTLQLVYYSFCTFFLVLGISYATSAVVLFFKDLSQIISILLQIGMWMTPIMWSYTIIPGKHQWIAKLNPMFYIVEGYRDTLLNQVWFWERYFQTAYFWMIALTFFGVGALIFKKLKPHFSDVL